MGVRYVDPGAEPSVPVEPYQLSADVHGGSPRLGLFANSFLGSVEFLDHLQAAISRRLRNASFHRYDKGGPAGAATVATPERLREIAARCDALVTAYGH